jgi:hypothetical protein
MIDADPQHNLLFSLHLYADWREADKYDQSKFSDVTHLLEYFCNSNFTKNKLFSLFTIRQSTFGSNC